MYFDQLGTEKEEVKSIEEPKQENKVEVYQCAECLTIYDPVYGDITQNVKPGVSFNSLPDEYICPVCDSPKNNFEKKLVVEYTE